MMDSRTQTIPAQSASGSWWKPLERYQKEVFILASLAWLFDCLGQQVFVIARSPALKALMPGSSPDELKAWAGYMTSIFVVGWATGGLIFGAVGDRIGRARALPLHGLVEARPLPVGDPRRLALRKPRPHGKISPGQLQCVFEVFRQSKKWVREGKWPPL